MKSVIKGLLVSTALLVVVAAPAMAQDSGTQGSVNPFLRGRYTAVAERAQPEFDPQPIRAGSFEIVSSLDLNATYNSNIFAQPTNEDSDGILTVRPAVEARSNWSSHQLVAGAWVSDEHYLDFDSENATDYNVYANGRLDVMRNFDLGAGVSAAHITEARYEPASVNAVDRAAFDALNGFVKASYRMDRWQAEATVGADDTSFDQLAQQVRDNTTTYVNARVAYAFTPDVAVFLQGRRSDLNFDQAGRDGTRTTIDAGVNFELAAPFRGEIAVGSFKDERDDPTFGSVDGLNVAANVQWFPTQLTTVTFSANRSAVDSGLTTAATTVNTGFGVRVDHELLRNVLLFADLRNDKDDYQGNAIDREDDALSAAVGAAWKLNRNARFEIAYTYRNQDSSGVNAGPDLDQHVISAGIRLYP